MKILLVEDVRSIAALMTFRLSQLGHEVVHAADGAAAVVLFKEIAPDLVLMDIEMPVMNGFEATTRIRAEEASHKWAWTPIIFLTVSDTPIDLLTAIEAGADDYLPKTVAEEVLFAKIKAMSRIAQLRGALCAANAKLEELATRDALTGMFNRRYMDMEVDMLWERARKGTKGEDFAVLMVDVDNFKKFNDTYGHQVGDDCLIRVAAAIQAALVRLQEQGRCRDGFCARYGGEEFAVILPAATADDMQDCADVLLESVKSLAIPHVRNESHGVVTISVGGKRVDPHVESVSQVFRQADAALYRSKESGRNRASFS